MIQEVDGDFQPFIACRPGVRYAFEVIQFFLTDEYLHVYEVPPEQDYQIRGAAPAMMVIPNDLDEVEKEIATASIIAFWFRHGPNRHYSKLEDLEE